MHISIQPDQYRVTAVSVTANSQMPDLLALDITEGGATTTVHLVLPADLWQRVADELAAAGVVPGGHRTTVLSWGGASS